MEKVILIRYGEIHLKGQNRPYFERKLLDNIKKALIDVPDVKVIRSQGRFYVEDYTDENAVIQALTRVFGIVSISPAYKIEKDFEVLVKYSKRIIEGLLPGLQKEELTFKVESRTG
jgi:thiamine biosynthesis protein ThiI